MLDQARRDTAAVGLSALAALPSCTLPVTVDDAGALHAWSGCTAATGRLRRDQVALTTLWATPAGHYGCVDKSLPDPFAAPGSCWPLVDELTRIRPSLTRWARVVDAATAGPIYKLGALTAARAALSDQSITLALLATEPGLDPAVIGEADITLAAIGALDAVIAAAVASPAHVAAVDAAVATAMVPDRWRGAVTLDSAPTLVGICGLRPALAPRVVDVVAAHTLASSPGSVLLTCPRFVADYLFRHYQAANGPWLALLQVVDVSGVSAADVANVALVWDPTGAAADLATVLAAVTCAAFPPGPATAAPRAVLHSPAP